VCPAGSGATCFDNHDGDGPAGVTFNVASDDVAVSSPAYGCGLADADFIRNGAMTSVLPASDTNTAKQVHLGLSIEEGLGASGMREDSCTDLVGATEPGGASLKLRAVGCVLRNDAACSGADVDFLDTIMPVFNILSSGATPPVGWVHEVAAKDGLLDRSSSQGGRSSLTRLGDIGSSSTCAMVRGATFLPFN
jgi:hypothetical protein